jgi:hypothetical protein
MHTMTERKIKSGTIDVKALLAGDEAKRGTMRRILLLVIIATFIGDGPALAGTLVEFPNLPGREPVHLIGYLARPDAGLSALISTTRGDAAVERSNGGGLENRITVYRAVRNIR